jgi:hypothetical protein
MSASGWLFAFSRSAWVALNREVILIYASTQSRRTNLKSANVAQRRTFADPGANNIKISPLHCCVF